MSPLRLFLTTAVLLVTASCDDRRTTSEIPTPTTVTIVPSLGMISHGNVSLQQLSGDWSASGSTGTAGHASFFIPVGIPGPFLITVCGDTGSSYFDEALGMALEFSANDCLRALLPDHSRSHVGVTVLTEAAVRRLEALGHLATASVADIEQAHSYVREHLLPEVPDLLQAPALVNSIHALEHLPNDATGHYALKLVALAGAAAALAAERTGRSRPALDLIQPLASDLADGKLDGLAGDIYIVSSVYDIHHLERLLTDQISLLDTRSDALSAILVTLKDTPLFAGITPAPGGDALLSWQGSYNGSWHNVYKMIGVSISGSKTLSDFHIQLLNDGMCAMNIQHNQLIIGSLSFKFEPSISRPENDQGIRIFSLNRIDEAQITMFPLFSNLPATFTSKINLVVENGEIIRAKFSVDTYAFGLDIADEARADCEFQLH